MNNQIIGSYLRLSASTTFGLLFLSITACAAQSPGLSHSPKPVQPLSHHDNAVSHAHEIDIQGELVVAGTADLEAFTRQDRPQSEFAFAQSGSIKQPSFVQSQATRLRDYLRKRGISGLAAPPAKVKSGRLIKYAWKITSDQALPSPSEVSLDLTPKTNPNNTVTLQATPGFCYTKTNHQPELPPVAVSMTHTESRTVADGETLVIADLVNPKTWLLMFVTPTMSTDDRADGKT